MTSICAERAILKEIDRRKETPDPIRDGIDDLQKRLEELSNEMYVIKTMIKNQQS